MILDGFKPLYKYMLSQNIQRCKFPYIHNQLNFDVFFLIDDQPFLLMFGARGVNLYFEKEVRNGFTIDTYLGEKYSQLCDALGIVYNPNNPFSPNKFFLEFNSKIPRQISKKQMAKPHDIAFTSKKIKTEKIEEIDKIYFMGWRNNNLQREQVSKENLEKTRKWLSYEAYLRCLKKNISSKWTHDQELAQDFYMPD
ncbi:MAG: hypothetical protein HC852_14870 [Acaryochloridaceae cyanobacterium RU_4_10]|nr:hypothetical protein [Acaryochloridaceae cyanobacterium RU_4_10]